MAPPRPRTRHYRRVLLRALNKNLAAELDYTERVARKHPKNYQVWYHRRAMVEMLDDASRELPFTARMLELDAKNYHCWSHRQWVLQRFSLWADELAYTDSLITADVRNNSAWNERYFTVAHTTGFTDAVCAREVGYALLQPSRARRPYFSGPLSALRFVRLAPDMRFTGSSARRTTKARGTICEGTRAVAAAGRSRAPAVHAVPPCLMQHNSVLANRRFADFPTVKRACLELQSAQVCTPFLYHALACIYEEDAAAGESGSAAAAMQVRRRRRRTAPPVPTGTDGWLLHRARVRAPDVRTSSHRCRSDSSQVLGL